MVLSRKTIILPNPWAGKRGRGGFGHRAGLGPDARRASREARSRPCGRRAPIRVARRRRWPKTADATLLERERQETQQQNVKKKGFPGLQGPVPAVSLAGDKCCPQVNSPPPAFRHRQETAGLSEAGKPFFALAIYFNRALFIAQCKDVCTTDQGGSGRGDGMRASLPYRTSFFRPDNTL